MLERRKVPLRLAIDAARHEVQTADAGTISYYADASKSGRPLLLLHGIHAAASAYEMRPLFECFRGERPVYALDLPGFGFSERGGRPYSPATYVHAIEHLLRNVAMERGVDVVALSLTGEYVAKVAVEMPSRALAVLLSPTGFATRDEAHPLERWARRHDKRLAARLGHLQSAVCCTSCSARARACASSCSVRSRGASTTDCWRTRTPRATSLAPRAHPSLSSAAASIPRAAL